MLHAEPHTWAGIFNRVDCVFQVALYWAKRTERKTVRQLNDARFVDVGTNVVHFLTQILALPLAPLVLVVLRCTALG